MIDSHTHLHLCDPPDAELVDGAARAGVRKMLTIGTDTASSRLAIAAAERFPDHVRAAVGQHPTAADELELEELSALALDPRVVAIGETGLDYYHDRAPRDAQRTSFIAHMELARETHKPLVVHTRGADLDTLDLLEAQASGLRVLLHCFSMPGRVEQCVEAGYWISFAGNVTYGEPLARAAEQVPPNRLLVETDAPYLAPKPIRGQPNEPAHVRHTAQFIAARRGVPYEEFEQQVESCAAELFGW